MRRTMTAMAMLLLGASAPAIANDSLTNIINDPNQWGTQLGDYAGTRYSQLD